MAAIDVSPVVSDIAAQVAPVVAVGLAVLLVLLSLRAWHWSRMALGYESAGDRADRLARDAQLLADYGSSEPPAAASAAGSVTEPEAGVFKGDGSSVIVGGTVFLDPGNSREALAELSEADRFLVEGLMERGRSFGSAMEAVYARNDAVERAEAIRKYAA